MGKVTGSSKNFPYTEVRTSVPMYDPKESDKVNKEIRLLEIERLTLQMEINEVEEYIANIEDMEVKEIFELYFKEGMRQDDIAKIVNIDRSYVSKKINGYLQDSHYSQK